jgi:molybdopterin-containing oxidoreductase family membrane subunit
MLEKALVGDKKYWTWVFFLLAIITTGFLFYLRQLGYGLGITGLSRDVTWGFYIAQFTFLVGVAASAVMVVLPYYLHNYKMFGKMTILGEFLAISAVTMCILFITVDLGQPMRAFNLMLHPSPSSVLFWDTIVLSGYLLLNVLISRVTLESERKGIKPPSWIKPIIILSIPWAISIHTVTAFIYSGLGGRPFWFTAILTPRFLASAFASGPAFLLLVVFIVRKFTRFDPGREPIQKLAQIITYAMLLNLFFTLLEIFTAFYSRIPDHMTSFQYLFSGLDGHSKLVPWMWTSVTLGVLAAVLLVNPKTRQNEKWLIFACAAVFVSIWIDKGIGMVVAGFVPTPLGAITEYWPTFPETMITLGVYALGFLMITIFYKIALSVRGEIST